MENFKIKTYGKSELALLYFPDAPSKIAALQNRHYWISRNEKLVFELNNCGTPAKAKFFTPREVMLIVAHLGEP